MTLTVTDLFTPAPSGVGPFGNVPLAPPQGSWLANMLSVATRVGLPTTAWQSGQPERTIFAVEAVLFGVSDAQVSIMAQGGFLLSSSTGSVTYTSTDGTQITIPVTPDPSNVAQNPTGALGYEDALAQSVYATSRIAPTAATGPLAVAKLTSGTAGPYAAGAYHVGNVVTGATYANAASLTIPSSIIGGGGGAITGIVPGASSTIITTGAPHGLAPGDSVYVVVPASAGISGLQGVFALVATASSTSLSLNVGSSGTYVSGGVLYACTVATMRADVAGLASSAAPGAVSIPVTQAAGVVISNILGWSGSNWESNAALADRCLLSLAARSPNGPSQAYTYFAESAVQLLAEATPPYVLTNGPVTATTYSVPLTGIVNVIVASLTPFSTILDANVTPGVAQLGISSISNANPAVITCVGPTTLGPAQSMTVTISGALGTAGVNGTFTGTYVSANSFSIPVNTTAAGTYTGGGTVEGGDLGQIDALIQANVVPDNTTAITVSANAFPISVVATVLVPQAYVTTYTLRVQAQLQAQIANYAIGGNAPNFAVEYDDIVGALEEAGVLSLGAASFVRQVQSLSIDGNPTGVGVPFPSPFYQAILVAPIVTVVGI